jgi:hypothetical protein
MTVESAAAVRLGLRLAHWTISDLWVASTGIGGRFTQSDVEAIVSGTHDATRGEHDILAAALNDHLVGLGGDQPVQYWDDLDTPDASS